METLIQEKLNALSVEEKIGQLLIVGLPGKFLTEKTKKLLEEIKPGSVILFSRNINSYPQVRKFTDHLQSASEKNSKLPLFVMVDQEGGSVTRVKVGTPLPSALALAQTKHPEFIKKYSMTLGSLLNHLGINMNLAPVLDISNPNSLSFIGSRSFGDSPKEVSELGAAFAFGQWESGVIPTAKHFPGHGGLQTDSHKETPMKNLSRLELLKTDIQPFRAYTELPFPSAVMLGHVSFPNIDSTGYPAAFSKTLNHNLLREELHYDGLTITDDLEMAGAEKVGDINERTIQAILSGNDMIMVAWSEKRQRDAYNTLLNAVRAGRVSEDRVNESVRRIIKAKLFVQKKALEYKSDDIERLRRRLVDLSKDVKKLSFQSSLKRSTRRIPKLGDEITIYSSDKKFFNNFRKNYLKRSHWISLSKQNVRSKIENLNRSKKETPFVFYVSGTGTARWLEQLSPENKRLAIVINTNQPGAIKNSESFLKVVHLNSASPESGSWLAEYLNQNDELRRPAEEVSLSD